MILEDFKLEINPLAKYYSDFKVEDRILLTGHSHQAWPNSAREGVIQSYIDAAIEVDDKWNLAFEKSDIVRARFAKLLNDDKDNITLAANTHDLLIRFLSSLDLKNRNKIITTDGEFHTVRRQLDALNGNYITLKKVSRDDISSLSERVAGEIDDKTSAVIISKVMFQDAAIVENLSIIAEKCEQFGAILYIDAYHALNSINFDLQKEKLNNAFITGGGYKYMQFGEGNCFLRIPPNYERMPLITGWFSEFTAIAEKNHNGVNYGEKHWAFAGATFDPVSNYRAASVVEFFEKQDLNIDLLRNIYLYQIETLNNAFITKHFDEKVIKFDGRDINNFGGFTVFKSKFAERITQELRKVNVFVDFRGENIRFGPAPYLNTEQLSESIDKLEFVIRNLEI